MSKFCCFCRTEWTEISQPGAYTTCSKCGREIHICLNCRNFDTTKPNQCKIGDLEFVKEKDRATFCDEFQFADCEVPVSKPLSTTNQTFRTQWDRLFKK